MVETSLDSFVLLGWHVANFAVNSGALSGGIKHPNQPVWIDLYYERLQLMRDNKNSYIPRMRINFRAICR